MEYKPFPTQFGVLTIVPTDQRHIFVHADNKGYAHINGAQYHVSAHFYLWNNGMWHLGQQFKEDGTARSLYEQHQDLYLTRPLSGSQTVSAAARRKAMEVLTDAVNEWAKNNNALLIEAEVEHLTRQVGALAGEIADAEKALHEKRERLKGLEVLLKTKAASLTSTLVG